jgi:26-hydroxylase
MAPLLLAGIINTEGRLWKEQRRFLYEKLRQFGMKYIGAGREQLEARIMVSNTHN